MEKSAKKLMDDLWANAEKKTMSYKKLLCPRFELTAHALAPTMDFMVAVKIGNDKMDTKKKDSSRAVLLPPKHSDCEIM